MPGILSSLRSLFGGKSEPAMDPAAFTEHVAKKVRAAVPGLEVTIVGDLELAIRTGDDGNNRAFLNNAYQMFLGESPKHRDALVDRFVQSFAEAAKGLERSADAIIPVIKDRAWLAETRESMRKMGNDAQEDHVHEDLNDELVVVYAIDTPSNIAYLNPDELDTLGVKREDLRALAVRNLRGLLPGIDVQRGEKLSMVTADGNYEASLLLFADLWERESARMRGAPVAAVPARDLLLFADSADADAVAQLRQAAVQARAEATYGLTDRIFVRNESSWQPI
ncbi:MAG TPA: DUF1444 family protein [Xanthomonadaceae bacterium]